MTLNTAFAGVRPSLCAMAATLTLAVSMAGAANARTEYLPSGTVIPVKLSESLNSKQAQSGDKFVATVVYGRDDAGLPQGTKVEGVVREATPSADGKPGVLDLDFRRIVIPGGQRVALDGSLISLDAKSVKRDSAGRLVASNDKSKDRLKFVGIGAGAGLVISALTKGNALFDTVLGAGAGYLYNELKKDKAGDVNLKAGTQFGVRVERQVAFNTTETRRYHGSAPARYNDTRYYKPGEEDVRDDRAPAVDKRDDVNAGDEIGMLVDGHNVTFGGAKPFVRRDVVFVPLDSAMRDANVGYDYDAGSKVIRARNGAVRLSVGSRVAIVDKARKLLPAAAEMRNGTLYVPMEFLGYITRGTTNWDEGSRTVIVTTDRD